MKRKAPAGLAAPVVKSSAKPASRTTIDESRTAVFAPSDLPDSNDVETIEISSDPNSSDEEDDEDEESEAEQTNGHSEPKVNGTSTAPVLAKKQSEPEEEEEESDAEPTSPSFGELLRGNETIDVPALLHQSSTSNSLQPRTAIVPPSHQSLTTVLTQALRTDDTDLLESCLHTDDPATIQNTIERIDSSLAGSLLQKLASRLYRRPGRAGKLMIWVQWTLIAHGGALATQPKVVQSLSGLQKVLAERAKGLNSLLALKGKLDLLEGQMDLRRRMQRSSGAGRNDDEDDEDDEDVIWVEGEDKATSENLTNGIGSKRGAIDDLDDDAEPVMNGLAGDSSDEEDDSEEADGGSDGDDDQESLLDENEVDHEEEVDDSMGDDDEDESDADAGPPPSKVQKVAASFAKRK